jgi:hypothetical protein
MVHFNIVLSQSSLALTKFMVTKMNQQLQHQISFITLSIEYDFGGAFISTFKNLAKS